MTDKVWKIREEVVRMHDLLPVMDGDNISVNYADRICTTLEMYIDSLQEEHESEITFEGANFNKSWYAHPELAFKAGAKWQEEKDNEEKVLTYKHGFEDCKEQLMANGVDGVVHHFEKCGVASVHYKDPTGVPMSYFMSPKGLMAGDKVKIIAIKEG